MSCELVGASTVILAENFNPSILTQHWLIAKGIVAEEDFAPDCVFVPGLTVARTRQFSFVAAPDRLQLALNEPDAEEAADTVRATIYQIVNLLPETPYRALGLNFEWRCPMDSLGPRFFWHADSTLYEEFDAPDARFGAYLSKDTLGLRLKLDVKPTKSGASEGSEHYLFQFNFHRDIHSDEDRSGVIRQGLDQWAAARDLSRNIMQRVQGRD